MMRSISIRGGKGGADALYVDSVPVPVVRPGEILIRVRAAGVNRPDIYQREDRCSWQWRQPEAQDLPSLMR